MYYAEAIVLGRYGGSRRGALLDDPRVIEYLKAQDATPWAAFKQMCRWLMAPASRAT